jgi:hypothetical protein
LGVAYVHSSSPAGEKLTAPPMFANLATRAGGSAAAMLQPSNAKKAMTAFAMLRRLGRRITMTSSPLSFSDGLGCKKYKVARRDCSTSHFDRSIEQKRAGRGSQ